MKKLLIIGSNTIHVYNYIDLIKDYFDDILLITDKKRMESNVKSIEADFHFKFANMYTTVGIISDAIKKFSPSVIHIHQANSSAFFGLRGARKFKIPKIVTAWGSDILISPHRSFILKKITQYNLRHADAFTSDSKFMAEEMRKLVPEKNLDISIANFGIDLPVVDLPKENIIYSNRLHKPLYRIDKVISAFKLFFDNSSDKTWQLVIAASGEETEHLKQQVATLGLLNNVKFVGWVNKQQNAEWYAKAKLFISIPESDATAISLLEAMSFGCLPIVSDLPANREWIENNKNGIVVNNITDNFIAKALEMNAENAAFVNKQIIAKSGTKAANKIKFIQLYDKLIDKK